jgi:hypothetical protein
MVLYWICSFQGHSFGTFIYVRIYIIIYVSLSICIYIYWTRRTKIIWSKSLLQPAVGRWESVCSAFFLMSWGSTTVTSGGDDPRDSGTGFDWISCFSYHLKWRDFMKTQWQISWYLALYDLPIPKPHCKWAIADMEWLCKPPWSKIQWVNHILPSGAICTIPHWHTHMTFLLDTPLTVAFPTTQPWVASYVVFEKRSQ